MLTVNFSSSTMILMYIYSVSFMKYLNLSLPNSVISFPLPSPPFSILPIPIFL